MTLDDIQAKEVLAANIRCELDEKGWSGRQLARECGESVMTIHNVLSARSCPSVGLVSRIARALKVSVDWLLREPEKSTVGD